MNDFKPTRGRVFTGSGAYTDLNDWYRSEHMLSSEISRARFKADRDHMIQALERGRLPTHRCRVCGAFWIFFTDPSEPSWSLFSRECGRCCDNVDMAEQIDPLPLIRRASNSAEPRT